MKRIVLALLALLGLVAQSAPLQARICGTGGSEIGAQVGVVIAARPQGQALGASTVAGDAAVSNLDQRTRECAQPVERRRPVYIPTVQLRVDRALE